MLSVRFTRRHTDADIAQLVERILGKDEVTSSNLVISSISLAFCRAFFVFLGQKMQENGAVSCICVVS